MTMMNSNSDGLDLKKLGHNITGTILRQGVGILIGLGLSILIARILGPTGNGQYAMTILLPTMLASFLNLGVAPANVYFIASRRTTPLSALKSNLWVWSLLSVIGVILGVIVVLRYSSVWFPSIPKSLLWVGIFAFPISLLQSFLASILQGLQDFKRYNYALLVTPGATFFLAAILIGVIELGVFGALIAFIGGQFIGLLMTLIVLRPVLHRNNEYEINSISDNYTLQCLKYGWKAHMSNILTFVNYRADIFLVNFFLSPAATGIYVIAVGIAERIWMLSTSVSTVLLPRLSELNKDERKRQQLTPLIVRWVLLVSAIGTVMMAALASPFIRLLYGEEFIPAIGALLWLLPGILMGSMARVLANDIAARGKPELNLYVAFLVVSVNVVANVILIPIFGIKGAALATTIAYTVNAVVKLWLYSNISKNPWWKPILPNADDLQLFQTGLLVVKKAVLSTLYKYEGNN